MDPDEVASIAGFLRNPQRAWEWLRQFKGLVDDRSPNAGHRALARLEELTAGRRFTVITQNVDGYHANAGNQRVLEIHGTIHRVRCHLRCGFAECWDPDSSKPFDCPACSAPVHPDLVMFGEMLDEEVFSAAENESLRADAFFSVGTSFTAQPAARPPVWAKSSGARVIEVNPHPTALSGLADFSIRSGALEFFEALCRVIEPNA
ncbi:MAG: NAD-dependent protein deacylase [Candidatus Accumulibacter sp.]|nr:NAD-dependent protein deacylase [Accumulibacter sp.]MCM8626997.1 NAD-dependent protein deacylase [Accumulibacter sp.]